jgi:hypothetical protein
MNQPVQEWIKKNPIIAFFAVAIAISFAMLFSSINFVPRDGTIGQILGYYIVCLGTYSPVIAAIFITRIIRLFIRKPEIVYDNHQLQNNSQL